MGNKQFSNFRICKERLKQKYTWVFPTVAYLISVAFVTFKLQTYLPEFDMAVLDKGIEILLYVGSVVLLSIGLWLILRNANYPLEARTKENDLWEVGVVNVYGEPPSVVKIEKKGQGFIYHLFSVYLSIDEYEKNKSKIENAWNVEIRDIAYGDDQRHIVIKAVESRISRAEKIYWEDNFLSDDDFIIKLGQGDFDEVGVDLAHLPHILLASGTGGGKTYLLNLILMQSKKKGADIGIVDFKGGMDYQMWSGDCPIITNAEECLEYLKRLNCIMDERREMLIHAKVSNIKEYNQTQESAMTRVIVVFDEVADVLGVKKKDKAVKAIFDGIEENISRLTRMGRAFGIHVILCYQRPSADALSGDIKANLGVRICGRADKIMSQMVLDNDDAAEMIKPNDEGFFVTNMGGFFKAYYYDGENALEQRGNE